MYKIFIMSYETKKGIKWAYRFHVPGENNKRKEIYHRGFDKKKDALVAGNEELKNYLNTGKTRKKSKRSYSDILNDWMENDVSKRCKETTVEGYTKKIKNIIKPKLGNFWVNDITKQTLINFMRELYDNGYSLNTLNSVRGILTASFRYAVDVEAIISSPASELKYGMKGNKPPKKQTRKRPHTYLDDKTMSKILERFPEGHPSHIPIMISYHCGLRCAEVFALTWDDIDLEKQTLKVNRQVQWKTDKKKDEDQKIIDNGKTETGNGYWYFSEPKYRSYREIKMNDEITSILKKELDKQTKLQQEYKIGYIYYYTNKKLYFGGDKPESMLQDIKIDSKGKYKINFVTVRDGGSFINPRVTQNISSVIHRELGIEGFTFHSFRHTHATILRDIGVPELYIQKRLGHASIDMTKVYVDHLTPQLIQRSEDLMENLKTASKENEN